MATSFVMLQRNVRSLAVALMVGTALATTPALPVEARAAPESFADLAEAISPAVVNITTKTKQPALPMENMPEIPRGSPFEDFFRDFMNPRRGPQGPRQSLGSGFVISEDGFIVTNNHVIAGADEITVEFIDGRRLEAKLIGRDEKVDIAVLKVEAEEELAFVPFGDSDVARVGDWVMAIGNPLGQGFSVSVGIISARNRELQGPYDDYIQTDAAINRGNSGGPLFNLEGEVIGVNTAILSPNGGSIGLGFSMSSNVVGDVVTQIREYGSAQRGWLGVSIQNLSEDVAEALGRDGTKGALVSDVPEGPARDAGIKTGDLIVRFDGEEVDDTRELIRIVGETNVGTTVEVEVFRKDNAEADGSLEVIDVTLGLREEDKLLAAAQQGGNDTPSITTHGLTLEPLTNTNRSRFNIPMEATGVLVTEVETTANAARGVAAGDVIVQVGGAGVSKPEEVRNALSEAENAGRKKVLMLVVSGGNPRFVALELSQ